MTQGMVHVACGIHQGLYPIAGTLVANVRRSLREVFGIPDDAKAFVGSIQVGDDHRLRVGDRLDFVRAKGVKGLGELLTPEQLQQRWAITREQYLQLLRMGLPAIRFEDQSLLHPEMAVDEWFRQQVGSRKGRSGRVCDISGLLEGGRSNPRPALQKEVPDKGKDVDHELPEEVTTAQAGSILGVTKDTVLKFKDDGLLQYRNAAPPSSSRPIFLFSLQSVLILRTTYRAESPTPFHKAEGPRRAVKGQRKYKHLRLAED